MDRKLEYAIDLDHGLGVVLLRARGELNWDNAREVSLKAREEAVMHGYGVFFDFRAVTLDASFAEMYRYPREAQPLVDPALRTPKCALLVRSGKDEAHWRFFEDSTRNAGLDDKIFVEDEKSALEWASGKSLPEGEED